MEKEYGYKTSDLKLEQLPKHLREEYKGRIRDDKLMLGLREDYELLSKLRDTLGKKYKEKEGRILKGFIMEAGREIGLNLEMEQLPGSEIL